ncbi:YihY/virulence factor BrkB family protein [Vicingus serpentipes]|jgi:membrane protein|uniref:YihY/virulence factor BrkB family protein n=1 Tax=Vicingus serpentipes TaxID=1926625 RepID=A0A5C6RVA5_9FLAO|nr:YihY/virulence factor BrkB family protein [Vicingus serpentipes]TXB66037.1 YihY/virulence factor BrkB family protein [Vicingus serpentipes]
MRTKLKQFYSFVEELIVKFVVDNSLNYSGSIAFFTIFSLPGILIGVILIAGSVFGENTVKGELYEQIKTLVGESSANQIQDIIQNLENADFNYVAFAIAVSTLLYGSTSVFASIQDGINVIWGLRPKPKRIALKFILNRLLSIAMIVTIGFLMLVSLSVDTLVVVFNDFLVEILDEKSATVVLALESVSFSIIVFVVFTTVYKFLPDAKVGIKDVLRGALLATILFMIGKYLISFYLGNSSFGTAYGAAGSLVLLLIWVYYSAMILLFGAEFIEVYTRKNNRIIAPSSQSVKIITKEVHLK